MNKSKYKAGTKVKIINPEFFVRCGYPETVESAREKFEKYFLEKHGKSVRYVLHDLFDHNDTDVLKFIGTFFNEWEEEKIINIMTRAYNREVLGFGGCERRVYTERKPEYEGEIMYIQNYEHPLIKKSGDYVHGHSGYSCDGEYDYEPAYLENVKTHVFYPVDYGEPNAKSGNIFRPLHMLMEDRKWIEKTNFEIIEEN